MKLYVLLFGLFLYSYSTLAQQTYSQATLDKIREVEENITGPLLLNDERPNTIPERMAKFNIKGLSIAVIEDYKIAWAKGYGWADEAEQRPVTTSTLFEPGSISKSLNAVGILKLAQEQKVDLNTDINSYLTSWKFPYDSLSKGKVITLGQILAHQAGLSTHGFPGHNNKKPMPTVYQVLDGEPPAVTPAVRSLFEPDLRFQYSGGGTTISQVLLTDVTKEDYATWMYENVLKPIGMVNSSYAQPPALDKRSLCASGYRENGTPIEDRFVVYPEQAAAGLWMTPRDLCQYIIDMQLAYQGQPSKVLSPEMVKLHLTPYHDGPTSMGSFIVNVDGALYFEHGARNDGFCGDFYGSLEDGYGVVIFLNGEDGRIINDVINTVAKVYNWKNFYHEPRRRNSIPVSDDVIKGYEGIYRFDDSWAGIGKTEDGYRFYTSGQYVKMHFATPTRFFNEEFQAEKEFTKDAKGIITGYTRTVDGKPYPSSTRITSVDTIHLEPSVFGDISWYLFEIKKFDEALEYFERGIELYPTDLNLIMNMGHAYLYKGDYKHAVTIYKAHLKDLIRPGYSFEDQLRDDVTYFKDHDYDIKIFDRVFEYLEINK